MSSEDLLKRRNKIKQDFQVTTDYFDKGSAEAERVAIELTHTRETLDDLDVQFCKATGLTKTDAIFLFVAIGLQIARQYILSNDKALS